MKELDIPADIFMWLECSLCSHICEEEITAHSDLRFIV